MALFHLSVTQVKRLSLIHILAELSAIFKRLYEDSVTGRISDAVSYTHLDVYKRQTSPRRFSQLYSSSALGDSSTAYN